MHKILDAFIRRLSTVQILMISFLLVAFVGAVDYLTGYELSFSIFYLAPTATAAWYAGRSAGFLIATASAAMWFLMDWTSGHTYSHRFFPFWNTAVRYGFFAITAHLLTALQQNLDREQKMAREDVLTALMNRRAFLETAQILFNLAKRHGHATVVGYIDLDNFKQVNDTRGHPEGDRLLRTIATVLLQSVRRTDFVGRLGGDEFAVLLSETSRQGAEKVFDELRERLLQNADAAGWPVTFSMGVVVFKEPPPSVDEAVRLADEIMYRVKRMGKNRILFEEYPLTETLSVETELSGS